MIKVIIFDFDGLLVNSQPLQFRAYNEVFSAEGAPMSHKDWEEWVQNSYSVKQWIDKNELDLDPEEIRKKKHAIYKNLIKKEIELKPGAKDLVMRLGEKYRLCIGSASSKENIITILESFGIKEKFEEVFSCLGTKKVKPFPDVFLKAAEDMGVGADECIVFEDSVAGLEAAKAAGMKCVVCPDDFFELDLVIFKGADLIVNSLEEVEKINSFIQFVA